MNTEERSDATQRTYFLPDAPNAIELAIQASLPSKPAERNNHVFEFARCLKVIPGYSDADVKQLQPLVREWHTLAKPNIRTKAFEETWADFVYAWPKVIFPKGREPMAVLFANAIAAAPPPEVQHFESDGIKLLASLCREMQRAMRNEPFFLSARTAGQYFGVDPSTAWRWMNLFKVEGLVVEVEKGSLKSGRASRFRYLGAM